MRSLRALRSFVVALLVVASLGCRRRGGSSTTTHGAHPRYWLRSTTLLDGPGGKPTVGVQGPTLVEWLPEGRVRSVTPEYPFEGFLPEQLDRVPAWGTGLALYVMRDGEMRLATPDGPRAGLVHAGAFVSVAPLSVGETGAKVAVALWEGTVYVDASILGTSVPTTPFVPPRPRARSSRQHGEMWVDRSKFEARLTMARCRDYFVDERGALTQLVDGIELQGTFATFYAPVEYMVSSCPAHAVVMTEGSGMMLVTPGANGGLGETRLLGALPEGYRSIEIAMDDAITERMRNGGRFYWLQYTSSGLECDGWRVLSRSRPGEPTPDTFQPLSARLVRLSDPRYTHEAVYRGLTNDSPGRLYLATVQLDGKDLMKCDCSYDYAVTNARMGAEAHMLARPLPPRAVAYDPREAERWFFSAETCEVARKAAVETLASDPAAAAELGFHAYTAPEIR